jgi:hypothetical protein
MATTAMILPSEQGPKIRMLVGYCGQATLGNDLLKPLRAPLKPQEDTVKVMSYLKAVAKPLIFQIPSAEPKIPWGKVARCCFELQSLTGNRKFRSSSGGPWVSWPGGPIFLSGHASSRTRDVSDRARAGSNCVLLKTDAVGEPDAGSLH